MPPELPWREAIEKVLREAPRAMTSQEITQKIIQDKLRSNLGATPAATVAAVLATAINNEGDRCPFQRVLRGLFAWRATPGSPQPLSATVEDEEQEEVQYEIITSFGMFWRRDGVEWKPTPSILGMQQIGAQDVDFHGQRGIYLLYDGRGVIYVGRATERPLGSAFTNTQPTD